MGRLYRINVAGLLSLAIAQDVPDTFEAIVRYVNSNNGAWFAEVPTRFSTLDEVRQLCGSVPRSGADHEDTVSNKTKDDAWPKEAPSSFDVRERWTECTVQTGHIRDQSACGSCWAFGSTGAFNDRHCIATGETVLLAVEDTLANCGADCNSSGCGGARTDLAWSWFQKTGVVTGGDYDDLGKTDTCAPYTLPKCSHHVPSKLPTCGPAEYPTPPAFTACINQGYPTPYQADKRHVISAYQLPSVVDMQKDIYTYGTATCNFNVYFDFPTYRSGVYHYVTGDLLGAHAVRMLGWGTLDKEDYWCIANSWNEEWGDRGFFKIRRGTNECGIESEVFAGEVAKKMLPLVV